MQQAHPQKADMAIKPNTHVRLFNLPYSLDPDASLLNPAICNLGSFHLGKLVTIRGTVVKAGPVKMFEAQKVHMCNKCKHRCVLQPKRLYLQKLRASDSSAFLEKSAMMSLHHGNMLFPLCSCKLTRSCPALGLQVYPAQQQ